MRFVALTLARLMAYKDEYEVARLHADPKFIGRLREQLSGEFKIHFHLAPPVLPGRDLYGRPKKRRFGAWMMPVFRILARLRGLRGTAFDVFGYLPERRAERRLRALPGTWGLNSSGLVIRFLQEISMDLTSYSTLKLERQKRLLRVTFNRPETMNAINEQAHQELARFFQEVSTDSLTDVVILTGAGRAFSAGGDLEHIQHMIDDPSVFIDDMQNAKRILFGILDCPKVLIAKVNGAAIGLGATIALLCDVIYAAEEAKFADPHVKVGFAAGDGGAIIWPHLIGHARAKEFLMTGRVLTGSDAARLGLINHAVPSADLDRVVDEFAQELLRGAMRAIQWTKLAVNIGLKQIASAVLDASMAYEALSNATSDHQEAVRAIREKREPRFTGK